MEDSWETFSKGLEEELVFKKTLNQN